MTTKKQLADLVSKLAGIIQNTTSNDDILWWVAKEAQDQADRALNEMDADPEYLAWLEARQPDYV